MPNFSTIWGKVAAWLTIRLLSGSRIGHEERQLLTAALLTKLGALPLHARITVDETGKMLFDGKSADIERARKLHDSAKSMMNNFARRFVRAQIRYMAIQKGVHENVSPEQGLFAKAALWLLQEEEELYKKLAGELNNDE